MVLGFQGFRVSGFGASVGSSYADIQSPLNYVILGKGQVAIERRCFFIVVALWEGITY